MGRTMLVAIMQIVIAFIILNALALLASYPLWKKGKKKLAVLVHIVICVVLIILGILLLDNFLTHMDG